VERANATVHGALDVTRHRGKAEAPLLGDLLLLPPPLDLRVDQRRHRRLLLDAINEQAMQHAELRRRQADAEGILHQLAHARDLLTQRVVDLLDRTRPRPQDRIAEPADARARRRPPGSDFRIELLSLLRLADLAVQLLWIDLIYRVFGHAVSLVRHRPDTRYGYCGSTSTLMLTLRRTASRAVR